MDNMNQHMHFGSYEDFVSNKYLYDMLLTDLDLFLEKSVRLGAFIVGNEKLL